MYSVYYTKRTLFTLFKKTISSFTFYYLFKNYKNYNEIIKTNTENI